MGIDCFLRRHAIPSADIAQTGSRIFLTVSHHLQLAPYPEQLGRLYWLLWRLRTPCNIPTTRACLEAVDPEIAKAYPHYPFQLSKVSAEI